MSELELTDQIKDLEKKNKSLERKLAYRKREFGETVKRLVQREMKRRQEAVKSLERQEAELRDALVRIGREAGAHAAAEKVCREVNSHLCQISIILTDLFEDYDVPPFFDRRLKDLADEMSQGAAEFQEFMRERTAELVEVE